MCLITYTSIPPPHDQEHIRFLFNQPIFQQLLQVRPVPKNKLLEIVVAEFLQNRCLSCSPTNSKKALKDELHDHSIIIQGGHKIAEKISGVFQAFPEP